MDALFLLALFVVAFLYSSVGHGGASGYLALMVLWGVDPALMKSSALILNLLVSATAFLLFYHKKYFDSKKLLPFVLFSFPAAFVGAMVKINPAVYKILLGIVLLVAIGRLLYKRTIDFEAKKSIPVFSAALTGLVIGFLSGMLGIGGGIILTPVLLLNKWANIKEAAALSAAFIFINSASGLAGSSFSNLVINTNIISWASIAFFGGLAGSYYGSGRFPVRVLQYILCAVLMFASLKLLMT